MQSLRHRTDAESIEQSLSATIPRRRCPSSSRYDTVRTRSPSSSRSLLPFHGGGFHQAVATTPYGRGVHRAVTLCYHSTAEVSIRQSLRHRTDAESIEQSIFATIPRRRCPSSSRYDTVRTRSPSSSRSLLLFHGGGVHRAVATTPYGRGVHRAVTLCYHFTDEMSIKQSLWHRTDAESIEQSLSTNTSRTRNPSSSRSLPQHFTDAESITQLPFTLSATTPHSRRLQSRALVCCSRWSHCPPQHLTVADCIEERSCAAVAGHIVYHNTSQLQIASKNAHE